MFTVVMLSTHFVLISTNQTTLEHFNARTTMDRENAVLDEMHSPWDFRCVSLSFFYPNHVVLYADVSSCFLVFGLYLRAKRRTRRKWDAEYGRIGREGNMWWLGSMRANWEQIFGPKTWTWLRTFLSIFFSNLLG
jgi:palmitoyltransferase